MNYYGQHFSDAADYKLDQEGFSQIPPPSNTGSNNPIDSLRDFTHTKKTDLRSSGPPTLDLKTTVRPPGPPTHQSNVATHPPTWFAYDSNAVTYPPAFANDWDDDGDLAVCPPPSIGSDSTNYIYPACPFIFGTNIVAHPSDPLAHGKKTDVHSPGPPTDEIKTDVRPSGSPTRELKTALRPSGSPTHGKKTDVRSPGTPNLDEKTAVHPLGPPTHQSNVATHPPTWFAYDSNAVIYPPAFSNDSDDDADLKVCPPPSIGSDSTNYIYPECPFIFGTNIVAHPSDPLAHRKKTDVRSPGPPTHEVKPSVRPSGSPTRELKTALRPSGSPTHGKKTDVRSPGPPTHQSNVATHPPTSFAYDSNAVTYPPAFANDNDDDEDLKVCPPPSIGSDSANYIYPACPFIFGTNIVAHPSDPSAHGKKTDIRSIGPPTHQPNVAIHPPTSFAYDSNAVIYPPAFANDWDDDGDLAVCPLPSIGVDSTNIIYPPFPFVLGTNIVAHSPTSFSGYSNIGMYPAAPSYFY